MVIKIENNKNYTNIEQGNALVENGLSTNTKEFYHTVKVPGEYRYVSVPCWSFTTLLDILPDNVKLMKYYDSSTGSVMYRCEINGKYCNHEAQHRCAIDAVVEAIIQCLQIGLIKKSE